MNVLDVFSRGDGKLNEPHLTSALAFLLDPTESHGLKTAFIREILEPISSQINERLSSRKLSLESLFSPYWAIEVETEERFKSIETTSYAQLSRDIDIVIRFCSSTGSCALMVAIENKIKKESAGMVALESFLKNCNADQKGLVLQDKLQSILLKMHSMESHVELLREYLERFDAKLPCLAPKCD